MSGQWNFGDPMRGVRGVIEGKAGETLFPVAPWKPENKVKPGWYIIATKMISGALEEMPGDF